MSVRGVAYAQWTPTPVAGATSWLAWLDGWTLGHCPCGLDLVNYFATITEERGVYTAKARVIEQYRCLVQQAPLDALAGAAGAMGSLCVVHIGRALPPVIGGLHSRRIGTEVPRRYTHPSRPG
jgi:hypothetical protein